MGREEGHSLKGKQGECFLGHSELRGLLNGKITFAFRKVNNVSVWWASQRRIDVAVPERVVSLPPQP